jgi:hypothetical protein
VPEISLSSFDTTHQIDKYYSKRLPILYKNV